MKTCMTCGRTDWEAAECRRVDCEKRSCVNLMKSANDRQVAGSHYASSLQHWDFVEMHGLGYIEGNATKYLSRWRKKNGLQDLEKALHYVDKLIELATAGKRGPRGCAPASAVVEFIRANDLGPREYQIFNRLCCQWTVEDLRAAKADLEQMIDIVKQDLPV